MIHLQSQSPNCCAHHAITVVDQLDCFGVKRKQAVAEEELHSVVVQLEADGLQERDVVTQNLLILKVKAHPNNFVYVIVAKEIEDGCFALNVLQPRTMCTDALAIHGIIFVSQWQTLSPLAQSIAPKYLNEHAECLQHLDSHFPSSVRPLLKDVREMLQYVVFKKVVQELWVMLIAPDHKFSNAA